MPEDHQPAEEAVEMPEYLPTTFVGLDGREYTPRLTLRVVDKWCAKSGRQLHELDYSFLNVHDIIELGYLATRYQTNLGRQSYDQWLDAMEEQALERLHASMLNALANFTHRVTKRGDPILRAAQFRETKDSLLVSDGDPWLKWQQSQASPTTETPTSD